MRQTCPEERGWVRGMSQVLSDHPASRGPNRLPSYSKAPRVSKSRPQNCSPDRLFCKPDSHEGGTVGFFWPLEETPPPPQQALKARLHPAPTPAVSRLSAAPSGQLLNPKPGRRWENLEPSKPEQRLLGIP